MILIQNYFIYFFEFKIQNIKNMGNPRLCRTKYRNMFVWNYSEFQRSRFWCFETLSEINLQIWNKFLVFREKLDIFNYTIKIWTKFKINWIKIKLCKWAEIKRDGKCNWKSVNSVVDVRTCKKKRNNGRTTNRKQINGVGATCRLFQD